MLLSFIKPESKPAKMWKEKLVILLSNHAAHIWYVVVTKRRKVELKKKPEHIFFSCFWKPHAYGWEREYMKRVIIKKARMLPGVFVTSSFFSFKKFHSGLYWEITLKTATWAGTRHFELLFEFHAVKLFKKILAFFFLASPVWLNRSIRVIVNSRVSAFHRQERLPCTNNIEPSSIHIRYVHPYSLLLSFIMTSFSWFKKKIPIVPFS